MGHQVHLVGKVHPDLKVVQACPVVQDKEGSVVIRDRKVKDYQDQLAIRVILDLLEDHLARMGLQGHKEKQDLKVSKVLQDLKDQLEDQQVLSEEQVSLVLLAQQVIQELQEPPVLLDKQGPRALQEPPVLPDLQGQQALQEPPVLPDKQGPLALQDQVIQVLPG